MSSCGYRTTACPEDWALCDERPVCAFAWRRCETTAFWSDDYGKGWICYPMERDYGWGARFAIAPLCERGRGWL